MKRLLTGVVTVILLTLGTLTLSACSPVSPAITAAILDHGRPAVVFYPCKHMTVSGVYLEEVRVTAAYEGHSPGDGTPVDWETVGEWRITRTMDGVTADSVVLLDRPSGWADARGWLPDTQPITSIREDRTYTVHPETTRHAGGVIFTLANLRTLPDGQVWFQEKVISVKEFHKAARKDC